MERWDIYNREGRPTGRTVSRGRLILRRGEYHLVVHIWAVDKKGNVLIQRRSEEKPLMPGEWAATGGAAIAGESSLAAAVRELREEMGIEKREQELKKITRMVRRNSLLDIYITETDLSGEQLKLQKGEVAEAKWITLDELKRMAEKGEFHNYGKEYFEIVFDAIEKEKRDQ